MNPTQKISQKIRQKKKFWEIRKIRKFLRKFFKTKSQNLKLRIVWQIFWVRKFLIWEFYAESYESDIFDKNTVENHVLFSLAGLAGWLGCQAGWAGWLGGWAGLAGWAALQSWLGWLAGLG